MKIGSLRFRFRMWQLRGYPWVPNWYKNLSILWSKKEQNLQAGVASTHKKIGEALVSEAEFHAQTQLLSGEGQVIMFEDGSSVRIPYDAAALPEGGVEMYPR